MNEPPTRDPRQRAADAALRAVRQVPPLGILAVVAALVELTLARVVWHGLSESIDPSLLFELHRQAAFPRNLAAVAGLVAVPVALVSFLRHPGYAPIGRRLAVAGFAGVFVPSVAVAALLPAAMLRPKLVVFGLAAANVLVALIALTAARYRSEPLVRVGLGLMSATAFLTLTVVGLGQLAHAQGGFWGGVGGFLARHPGTTQDVRLVLRHIGEIGWVGVLVSSAIAAAWDRGEGAMRARIGGAVALTVALTVGLVALQEISGHRFRFLLFGSFRLGLFVDDFPIVYLLPLALGLAGGLIALVRRDPTTRQLGAAILAWFAAGFAPHTPIQLLYLVLSAVLMARAAQARDPEGAWRHYQPWARLIGKRPVPAEDPALERAE